MPRGPTYHEEQQALRRSLKPYDRNGPQAPPTEHDSDSDERESSGVVDSDNEMMGSAGSDEEYSSSSGSSSSSDVEAFDTADLLETLEEPSGSPEDGNIFNPTRRRNNCFNMAASYASGLPLEDIDDGVGSPPDENKWGIDAATMESRAADNGFEFTDDPPDAEYMDGAREAGVAYPVGVGVDEYGRPVTLNHWAAIDGGDCPGNYTYTNHQGEDDQDVTDAVRGTPAHMRRYIVRPVYEDMERREFEFEDEDDSD
jgi:hypothetical protein